MPTSFGGREGLFRHLMLANPEHLDLLIFPAGITLAVPHVETPMESVNLPPWME